jgi:Janus/Ocnus family (Ocnus)
MSKTEQLTLENYSVEVPRKLGDSKFILIKETLEDGSERWAIVCKPVTLHWDIMNKLKKHGRDFTIHGGGRLQLVKDEGVDAILTAYGKSIDYGKADSKNVGEILTDWCENHIDRIKPTKYEFINKMGEDIIY